MAQPTPVRLEDTIREQAKRFCPEVPHDWRNMGLACRLAVS